MKNKKHFVQVMALVGAMTACTSQKAQNAALPDVSFSRSIIPIFHASCAINSSCHLGANNTNLYINLDDCDAYNTIVNKQLINTSNPTASLLYVQISNGIMPKAPYSLLPADKVTLVLNWIRGGGKNN